MASTSRLAGHRVLALALALVCLAAVSLVGAVEITGAIEWNVVLPAGTLLRPDTAVTLNGTAQRTFIRKDGSFVFPDVPPGVHVLEVLSDKYFFETLLITLTSTSIHIQPYAPTVLPRPVTPSLPSRPYPLALPALGALDPFDPAPSLGLGALLASPMALMMLATAAMAFGLPSLMKWMGEMDPESAKEVAEMRRKAAEFQSTDWGGKLAGVLAGSPSDASTAARPAGSAGGGGGANTPGNRKRGKR